MKKQSILQNLKALPLTFAKNLSIKLTILLLILPHLVSRAQNSPKDTPPLIIGIIIDNLRSDMIYRYWNSFENNGFRRLINEGTRYNYMQLNYFYTQTAPSLATLASGTYPCHHGIVADEWYDQLSDKIINATADENSSCIGCGKSADKHSPKNILSSTIGDEIRLATFKQSRVFSVSLDPTPAILLAGHLANAAFWLDNFTGKFVTSSAYLNELPQWVKNFNDKKLPSLYLQQTWNLTYPDSLYAPINLPDNNRYEKGLKGKKTFPYDLKTLSLRTDGSIDYGLLKNTPFANNLVKDFAINLIVNENLGKDPYPDLLLIHFNASEYIGQQFGLLSYEMHDAFIRLDKEIAHLLSFIDSYIGKQNVLIFLTSSHGAAYPVKALMEWNMPAGQFNPGQAYVLLKSYLKAIYGEGEWIKLWKNQQIYLNHNLIQQAGIDKSKMQNDIARFLLDFNGIAYVATSNQMLTNSLSLGVVQQMANSFYLSRSGDVMYALLPYWTEMSESLAIHNSGYSYDTQVPLIFYGWRTERLNISRPVDVQDLAASLSVILKIPFPSACQGTPLPEIIK